MKDGLRGNNNDLQKILEIPVLILVLMKDGLREVIL